MDKEAIRKQLWDLRDMRSTRNVAGEILKNQSSPNKKDKRGRNGSKKSVSPRGLSGNMEMDQRKANFRKKDGSIVSQLMEKVKKEQKQLIH